MFKMILAATMGAVAMYLYSNPAETAQVLQKTSNVIHYVASFFR